MRIPRIRTIVIVSVGILAVAVIVSVSHGQAAKRSDPADVEKTVLARLGEIQNAAQALDADKVFSFVLENDQGAPGQNGQPPPYTQECSGKHEERLPRPAEGGLPVKPTARHAALPDGCVGGWRGYILLHYKRWEDLYDAICPVGCLCPDERRVESLPRTPFLSAAVTARQLIIESPPINPPPRVHLWFRSEERR